MLGIAGTRVQVRNPEAARTKTTAGAFMNSRLPVAGFTIIEAEKLEAAVALVSKSPCAVAHRVDEVWPLEQPS